ncbi:hypothetical protein K435DRAFT_794690 [Dendrothele bispora CBS 962.96]|uniref:Uncharacterized protein n=1 Tax=Dendrothele bispora (strain CBS 962.96) TaxID=1314807 RepID=A0A4S8MCP2_DENBC|nr:hypothetical protein K435DRAFT_794690 [Dendrothele bispora CBS 962.96]
MTVVTVMMTVEENVGVHEYLSDKWTDGVLVFCRVWNLWDGEGDLQNKGQYVGKTLVTARLAAEKRQLAILRTPRGIWLSIANARGFENLRMNGGSHMGQHCKLQVEGLVIDRAVDVVDYYSIPLRPDGIFTTHPFKTSSSHIAGPSKYCFYRLLATWPYPVSHYHLPLLIQIVHDPLVLPTSTPFVLTVTHVPYSTTAVVPLSTSSFRRPYLEPEGKYDSHTSEIRSSSSDTKTSIQGS